MLSGSRRFGISVSKRVVGAILFAALLMLMSVVLVKIFSDLAFADEHLPRAGFSHFIVRLFD